MTAPQLAEAFPAGQMLAKELTARGWTQIDLAEILGRPTQFVSEIIAGKKEITRESAAQLAAALDTTAEFWLNLQDSYFLWRHAQDSGTRRELDEVRRRARLNQLAPVGLLVRRGVISAGPLDRQEQEIRDLFELDSLDDEPGFVVAARQSGEAGELSSIQKAWVACVRRNAWQRAVGTYSVKRLKELGAGLATRVTSPEEFGTLPDAFGEAGVRLVYVEQLPSSKIDGCSFMLEKTPVIGLSGRGKRLDKVLFTLLHEIAHVTLGHVSSKKAALIVEDVEGAQDGHGREHDANALAAGWILPSLPSLPDRLSANWVDSTAHHYGVAPIVLIGQLQKHGVLPWRTTLVKDAPTVTEALQAWV